MSYKFFNNFLVLLLCKKKFLNTFNKDDFFLIFCYMTKYWNLDRIKILVDGNVWHVPSLRFDSNLYMLNP